MIVYFQVFKFAFNINYQVIIVDYSVENVGDFLGFLLLHFIATISFFSDFSSFYLFYFYLRKFFEALLA